MDISEDISLMSALRTYRLQLLVTILLIAGLYHSIVLDMMKDWYNDPNYSHGFIVPLIAGYFVYLKLDDLKKTEITPSNSGLLIMLAGLVLLVVAFIGTEYFTMRASLIVVLAGLVLYFFGKDVFGKMSLPLAYLIFMVPLPYIIYDSIAFPLKLFVSKYSVLFLKALGIVVMREGNVIMFPTTVLEVADACSGIRSIMSLIALSVAFAYFSQSSNLRRSIVIVSAVPIAIFANAVRVIVTGILAQYWGARAAEGFFHEFAGLAVFGIAIVMLVMVGVIVRRVGR